MTAVRFLPEGKRVEARTGETLLEVARRGNVDFLGPCAGMALCAKCVVRVVGGESGISRPSEEERSALPGKRVADGYRLGCRCKVEGDGDVTLFVPEESKLGEYVLLSEGQAGNERFDPLVKRTRVGLVATPETSLVESLAGSKDLVGRSFTLRALARLSQVRAKGAREELDLIVRGGVVLDAREECRPLGFAVDIGTTKVAGYLVDLEDGTTLSVVSDINPQIPFGEDVISRLTYAIGGGLGELQARIVECINKLLERACAAANRPIGDVYEIVAVGNPVMHHVLLGLDPRALAYSPYTPTTTASMDLQSSQLKIQGNVEARLFLPPLIAGYVGSDVTADIIATGLDEDPGPSILLDIGTNTEVVVKKDDKLLVCSTASGPAFEGAHISCGMRAATGAIDRVAASKDGECSYSVIGGGRPRGLTGSAVVDVIAGLFNTGLIDKGGRLSPDGGWKRMRTNDGGYREYVIAYESETAGGTSLAITQKDVREIQLAKGAIRAGLNILMGEMKLGVDDVRTLRIAGAFGFFLNPISAESLGLYPEFEVNRIRLVGNTAVTGARALLLSKTRREAAERVVRTATHINLATHKQFRTEFLRAMSIPYDDGLLRERTPSTWR